MLDQHWQVVNRGIDGTNNTAEDLWFNACAYFKWCDENPIKTKETLKSGKEAGRVVTNEQIRPYSIKGLCLHCGITQEYLKDARGTKDTASEYYIVVSRILYIIYVQNLEHAVVGNYNAIFVSKLLNIDNEDDGSSGAVKVEIVNGIPPLSYSENAVLEKMTLEIRQNSAI